MSKYRTAMGKTVDMSALAAKNEGVRAVGNLPVNARGDTIDAAGRVVEPSTSKVSSNYQKTVGNRGGNAVKAKPTSTLKPDLTSEELEIEQSFDDDFEIEQIKARENK
jgi:hypothetical protein